MSHQRSKVNGDRNMTGNTITNISNRTYITSDIQVELDTARLLESKVAFDALLNSEARYPAPKCHPETRSAIKGVLTNWIHGKGDWSDKDIVWMSGAPGVGKSAILQTVCQGDAGDTKPVLSVAEIEVDNSIDACFFFGRGLGDREKASFFPATIAYQVAHSRSPYRTVILKIIAKEPSILHEAFPSQFRKLVIRPAKRLGTPLRPITIVIDALDECNNPTDQIQLLDLIFEAITTTDIRVLIASRPEQDIHAFFQRKDVSHHTYHIQLDEETFNTSKDIEILLRSEFARIRLSKPEVCRPLPNGEEWPGSVVIYRLRDDSDCQFIYSRLAIDYIDTPFFSPDQQLKTLLAAPPNRVFSKLDALYHHILSRHPPELLAGSDELLAFQKLIMGVLRVVISWPGPLSATGIARVLGKDVDVVQSIVRGPMRSLFKFDPTDADSPIALCHKSLRDYLLDRHRSQEFFLPSAETDTLFTQVLTRIPPANIQQSYRSRELLVGVLVMVVACLLWENLHQAGPFLGVIPHPAEEATFIPTATLLKPDALDTPLRLAESATQTPNSVSCVDHSITSVKPLVVNRAGEPTVIPSENPFTQILSRQPSQELLVDVLTVVLVLGHWVKLPQIASALEVAPSVIEDIIKVGPIKDLFKVEGNGDVGFSSPGAFKGFLQDGERAGRYFIPRDNQDALFTRMLSREASREALMDVLKVLAAWYNNWLTIPQLATVLDVDPAVVEGIIFGPAQLLFYVDAGNGKLRLPPAVTGFLFQDSCAGEFYILPAHLNPNFASLHGKIYEIVWLRK